MLPWYLGSVFFPQTASNSDLLMPHFRSPPGQIILFCRRDIVANKLALTDHVHHHKLSRASRNFLSCSTARDAEWVSECESHSETHSLIRSLPRALIYGLSRSHFVHAHNVHGFLSIAVLSAHLADEQRLREALKDGVHVYVCAPCLNIVNSSGFFSLLPGILVNHSESFRDSGREEGASETVKEWKVLSLELFIYLFYRTI